MLEKYQEYLKKADLELITDVNDPGLFKSENWIQLTTENSPTHWRNGIFHSVIDNNADEKIKEVILEYVDKNLPFRWLISPYSSPRNLEQLLIDNGFNHFENSLGLILDVNKYQTRDHKNIEVKRIEENEIEVWCDVYCNCWGIPEQAKQSFIKELNREFRCTPLKTFYYLASYNGKYVGATQYTHMDGFVSFAGAVVEKKYRRKGIYKAMIDKRVNDLKKEGFEIITNFCVEDSSAPICLKLGFEKIYKYSTYIYEDSYRSV
jgi:predicted GNAT family acetyltransferase